MKLLKKVLDLDYAFTLIPFSEMTADFKALDIGYEVQKSFANKFFANKNVAKGLIDQTSATLLDELYKLIKIYVSFFFVNFCNIGGSSTCAAASKLYTAGFYRAE